MANSKIRIPVKMAGSPTPAAKPPVVESTPALMTACEPIKDGAWPCLARVEFPAFHNARTDEDVDARARIVLLQSERHMKQLFVETAKGMEVRSAGALKANSTSISAKGALALIANPDLTRKLAS